MADARPCVGAAGRSELIAMILFGIGWLVAMLAIPALVWIRMLRVAPDWMGTALLSSSALPVGLGLLYAVTRRAVTERAVTERAVTREGRRKRSG